MDVSLLPPFTVIVARLYVAIDRGDALVPGFAADAVPVQAALDAAPGPLPRP